MSTIESKNSFSGKILSLNWAANGETLESASLIATGPEGIIVCWNHLLVLKKFAVIIRESLMNILIISDLVYSH